MDPMTDSYSELWHIPGQPAEIRSRSLPTTAEDTLVVKARCSLISSGTEKLVISGGVLPSVRDLMTVPYMQGDFSEEFTYGYSLVGHVLSGPDDLLDKRVHLMHPHQDLVFVNRNDVYPVPENIPDITASLASNLETVVNAIWDSGVSVGDNVLIAGYGMIGAMLQVVLQRIPGVNISILERSEPRTALARERGIEIHKGGEEKYDLAFHTTGSSEGLQSCIDHVSDEGQIIELSWYGDKDITVRLGGTFHPGRKKIISSQVSSIPPDRMPFYDLKRRKDLVFRLLSELDFGHIVSHEVRFDDAPAYFEELKTRELPDLGAVIIY